jgi:hypothetical protein
MLLIPYHKKAFYHLSSRRKFLKMNGFGAVAVSDLFPDRCAELAKVTRCKKTYPSLICQNHFLHIRIGVLARHLIGILHTLMHIMWV